MSDRVLVEDLAVSIADGVHDGFLALHETLTRILEVVREDDPSETMVRLRRAMVYRTAERLYCQRLAVIASMAPMENPDPATLRELARHCWLAADLLALMDPENPDRRRDGDALVDLGAVAGVPAAGGDTTSTAAPQSADSAGLDGGLTDW